MHPEIAKTLVAQHRDELVQQTASRRRTGRRHLPRWHISWTRTVLAPAAGPAPAADRAGQTGRRGSSLVIISPLAGCAFGAWGAHARPGSRGLRMTKARMKRMLIRGKPAT